MGDDDDITARMGGDEGIGGGGEAGGGVVPAFAIRGAMVARRVPIGKGQLRVAFRDGIPSHAVPIAEMQFPQARMMRQTVPARADGVGGGHGADQVG